MYWNQQLHRNHSYQTVIKENTFGSTVQGFATKERWILEGKRWLYLMHEKLEFDFHPMIRFDIQP